MDKVLVDGVDVTALVVGVLTDWQSSKTLSFADSATDLTVCGSDLIAIDRSAGEFWCPDGDMTACAGFALSCAGGRWDGVATDTTWLVTARGTDPSALVPDANSETLAVASTSPFAWGAAGDKIWSAAADEAACFTKVIAPDKPIGSEDAPIGSDNGSEDAPIGSDNGNNPSPRPTAGPAPRPADTCTAEEAARETAEAALVSAQAERDAALARAAQAESEVDALVAQAAQAAQDGPAAVASSSEASVDMGFCTYEMNDVTISTPCADLDTHMTTGQVSAIQYNDRDGDLCRDRRGCGEKPPPGLEEEPTVPGSCTSGYGNAPIAFLREASLSMSLSGNSLLASIDALTSLTSIGGSLTISNNPVLANLDGLRNLRKVARGYTNHVVIQDNPGLTSLELSNLREIGGTSLTIKGNTALRTISFPSLTELGFQGWEVQVGDPSLLRSVDGAKQWTINGGGNFVIEGCSSLETISAPVLRQIGHSLIIQDNGDYALNEGSVFSLEKIGAYVTRAHYQSIIYTVHGATCPEFYPECFSKQTDQGPLYSYPPATCTGLGLDFFGLSGCPTCEQEWDLTACAHTRNTLCGVLVCKGSSGSGNKSSGGKVAASTSYIIVIVILAVLLFASLCYIIVKQRAERAAPHSRKSMPTIISSEA